MEGNEAAKSVKQQSQTEQEVNLLSDAIASVNDSSVALENRLVGILTEPYPPEDEDKAVEVAMVPLAGTIRELRRRVLYTNNFLQQLLKRLEL